MGSESGFENELTLVSYKEEGNIDEFHRAYEAAVERVRDDLGRSYAMRIGDASPPAESTFEVHSPGNTDLRVGSFPVADGAAVDDAVDTAKETFSEWRKFTCSPRVRIVRQAADEMSRRKFDLAARITIENGKTRSEAMADVDEAIDFLRYYAVEIERHEGYVFDRGEPISGEHCTNLMRPYGVFGVISPFNFPLAILTGMTTGAFITGNTVVLKPAEATPSIAYAFFDILESSGLPEGVVNLVTGPGEVTGRAIVDHPDVDGVVFTGSRTVGTEIQRRFLELDKRGPVIAELGGKNPVIVTDRADIDKAVSGIANGAFGFSGQKCSATARVYIESSIFDTVVDGVVAEAESIPDLPPEHRDARISPIIDAASVERYRNICANAAEIGTIHTGGSVVQDETLPNGRYVRPTVVTDVPHDHSLARDEHFLPFVTFHPVRNLDEGLARANDSEFGLCAGIFSEDTQEIEAWFDRIEAGMAYANRARSATTGALVRAQPFGGWKFSGTTGKFAGGRWYLPQFMREQSQTRVVDRT